jgi:VanZ family protein
VAQRINVAWALRGLIPCAVQKLRHFAKYWLPVLAWMALIFTASGDVRSFQHSSRLIEPLLRFLFPHMADATVREIVFGVRKLAHFTEYAVLAILVLRGIRQPRGDDPRPWVAKHARLTVLVVALYAASDEWHQLFVPTRQASVVDVTIDTFGGTMGILAVWVVGRWRRKW